MSGLDVHVTHTISAQGHMDLHRVLCGAVRGEVCVTQASGAADSQTEGDDGATAAAASASVKLRIMLRRLRFGKSDLFSSVAPVDGDVSFVRSHSEMAVRS